ncbi:hypothetical protein IG193_01345 [Infirmifilum lucidum]|uniref:DUF5320 domain-containing protein n=1 Tax=Infirmifilum lucidum TaxID=2776706 RepID=A0A7L9FL90_9CREN|nr:hypothetical protein IG193_01345 [Infirmifilum lucidum]
MGWWRRGRWPGNGPWAHLPPWERPGWIYGPGYCWRAYGVPGWYYWRSVLGSAAPQDEARVLEEYKRFLEEELRRMNEEYRRFIEEEIARVEARLKELKQAQSST